MLPMVVKAAMQQKVLMAQTDPSRHLGMVIIKVVPVVPAAAVPAAVAPVSAATAAMAATAVKAEPWMVDKAVILTTTAAAVVVPVDRPAATALPAVLCWLQVEQH